MIDSILPLSPELIGSTLAAIATLVGTLLSIRYTPLRNKIMMKNFWHFVTTRQNIRNILELKEIEEKNFRYRRIFISGSFIPPMTVFILYQIMQRTVMIWSLLLLINIVGILIILGFYVILPLKLSEKIMRIYKICRIPVYAILISGLLITLVMLTNEPNLIYPLSLVAIWFIAPIPIDYLNWSLNKELSNKLISKRLKENYEKMPIFHFSFKISGNIISGKFRAMNKDYIIIRDIHDEKDTMIMWKDLEICSIDNK